MSVAFKTPVRESNPGSGGNGSRRSPYDRERVQEQQRSNVRRNQDKMINNIKRRAPTH